MISMDVTVEWMNHMHIVSNLLSILNMNHVVRLLPQWIPLKRMHPLGKTLCYKNHFVIDFSNTTTVSLNFHHTHTSSKRLLSITNKHMKIHTPIPKHCIFSTSTLHLSIYLWLDTLLWNKLHRIFVHTWRQLRSMSNHYLLRSNSLQSDAIHDFTMIE